jgi:hypothetical protein
VLLRLLTSLKEPPSKSPSGIRTLFLVAFQSTNMQILYAVAASAIVGSSFGDSLRKDQYCLDAVYEALSGLSFEGSSPDDYWGSACQSPLKVGSMYAAGMQYCTDHEIDAGISLLSHYCEQYGEMELLPISEFKYNLTAEYIKAIRVIEYNEIPTTENITTLVMISPTYFGASHRTVVCRNLLF